LRHEFVLESHLYLIVVKVVCVSRTDHVSRRVEITKVRASRNRVGECKECNPGRNLNANQQGGYSHRHAFKVISRGFSVRQELIVYSTSLFPPNHALHRISLITVLRQDEQVLTMFNPVHQVGTFVVYRGKKRVKYSPPVVPFAGFSRNAFLRAGTCLALLLHSCEKLAAILASRHLRRTQQ
jgi:hypothetical protein